MVLCAALAAATLALAAGLTAGGAGAQTILPDCAPGTPAPAPPTPNVTGDPGSPTRVIAGRRFSVEYDSPGLAVAVQDTAGPPGTVFDFGNQGDLITVRAPSAGAVPLTARYYDVRSGTCVHSFTFTVAVEPGDLVPPGIGAGDGGLIRGTRLAPLPRGGLLAGDAPKVGLEYPCEGVQAVVPLSAVLRIERRLFRRPSTSSETVRLDIPDPCQTGSAIARAPGVLIRFVGDQSGVDEGVRILGIEHPGKGAGRFWVQVFQGTRLLGGLRYYTAFRPAARRFTRSWVIAPEAAFERARCRRPPGGVPLGFRTWPFPPCARA